MIRYFKIFGFLLMVGIEMALPARAADWLGTASQDFNTAANWSELLVPDANCYIDLTTGNTPILSVTPANNVGMLQIGAADGAYAGNGYMKQTGGALTVDTDFAVGYGYTGTYDMSGGSFSQAAGDAWVGRAGTGTLNIGLAATDNPTFTYSSGGWLRVSADSSGAKGTVNVNAGTFNVTNLDVGLESATFNVHNNAKVNTSGTVYIGDGGTGDFAMDGTSTLNQNAGGMTIGNAGIGTMTVSGTATYNQNVGNFNIGLGSGNGTLTVLGAAKVNLYSNPYSTGRWNVGANNSYATINIGNGTDNPTLTMQSTSAAALGDSTGHVTVNVNSGSFLCNSVYYLGIGYGASTTVWNQNGGYSLWGTGDGAGAYWGASSNGDGACSNNTLNLNGGVLATGVIKGDWALSANARANMVDLITFNGGTVQATGNTSASMPFFWTRGVVHFNVYITSRGGTFDTNGHSAIVGVPLQADPASPGGGFTKIGAGQLIMDQNNTYTGTTAVNAGELVMLGTNATKVVTIQSGATLTLANAAPFTALASAPVEISVPTGATLNCNVSGGNPVEATNANVTFGNKSYLSVSASPYLSTLDIKKLSSTASGDKVIVDLPGLTVGNGGPVLTYQSKGTYIPTFLPRVDSLGMDDITLTNDTVNKEIDVDLTDQTGNRAWEGILPDFSATTQSWVKSAWHEPGNYYASSPSGTAARAWFNDWGGAYNTDHNVILDTTGNVTLSSLLFNGTYTIQKNSGANPPAIVLQTSIAADTQIQAIAGDSIVYPDIYMAAGDPVISVSSGASLTLNGILRDITGQHAAISITGPGTLTLNGANTYSGPTVLQGGGTLMVGNASALGAAAAAFTFAGGTLTDAGANVVLNKGFTIAGADTLAPVHNLTFTGAVTYTSGSLLKLGAGTATFNTPAATTNNLGSDLEVHAGTMAFDGVAGSVYNFGKLNLAGIVAGTSPDYYELYPGANASLTVNNVSVVATGNVTIGNYWSGAVDTATRPIGALTLSGSATMTETGTLTLGYWGGKGTVNVGGSSTLTVNSTISLGYNWGTDAAGQVGYGEVNVNDSGHVVVNGQIRIGDYGSSGVWNQNGGLTETTASVMLAQSDSAAAAATGSGSLNLNGGTFLAPGIATGSTTSGNEAATLATVNFNGGVLKASGDSSDYIANTTGATLALNVLKNASTGLGAVIDTNGFAVTINQPLATGVVSGADGGLKKLGLGTLTLAGPLSYTGKTTLSGGTLQINAANTLSGGVVGSGNLGVGDGTNAITLKLTGTENMSGLTTINAGSTLQILSGSNTMGIITGAGSLTVANNATLRAPSITVDTLTIGGTVTAAAAVPEPGTLVLLALAGLACAGAYLRRK